MPIRGSGAGYGVSKFTDLTDVPGAYTGQTLKGLRLNAGETALEFYTRLSKFTDLSDVPGAYTGQSLKALRINAGETALEFYTRLSKFIELSDAPAAYTGQAGKYPRVNAGETALEFNPLEGSGKHDLTVLRRASDQIGTYYNGGTWVSITDSGCVNLIDRVKAILGERISVGLGRASPANPFDWDDELVVGDSGFSLEGCGMGPTRGYLRNGVNKDAIDITSGRYVNLRFANFTVDCNKTNNPTGGDGINGLIASGAVPESMGWWIEIENVRMLDPKVRCFDIGMTTSPASPQIRIINIRGYGGDTAPQTRFENCYDSVYNTIYSSSIQFVGSVAGSKIANVYYGGGGGTYMLLDGDQIQAENIGLDQSNTADYGLYLKGNNNTVKVHISDKAASNAAVGIHINGDGNYVKAHFSDDAFGAGETWAYLVDEAAGSDWNLVDLIDPWLLYSTGQDNLVGVNSKVNKLI